MESYNSDPPEVKSTLEKFSSPQELYRSRDTLRAEFNTLLRNAPLENLEEFNRQHLRPYARIRNNPIASTIHTWRQYWLWEELDRREAEKKEEKRKRRRALYEALAPPESAETLAQQIFDSREPKPKMLPSVKLPIEETCGSIKPYGREFASQLRPDGSPSAEEGYWILSGPPRELASKISLHPEKGGAFYSLNESGDHYIIRGSNYVMFWIYVFYGYEKFSVEKGVLKVRDRSILAQATRDCLLWVERMDAGYAAPVTLSLEDRYEDLSRRLARLIQLGGPLEGSAKALRRELLHRARSEFSEADVRSVLPELFLPTKFRRCLRYLAEHGSGHLAVTEREVDHNAIFTLRPT
jgi:hypothetical protein